MRIALICTAAALVACGSENNDAFIPPGQYVGDAVSGDTAADGTDGLDAADSADAVDGGDLDVASPSDDVAGTDDVSGGDDLADPPDVPVAPDDVGEADTALADVVAPDGGEADLVGPDWVEPDLVEPDVSEPDVVEPDPTATLNAGWIGGACDAVADCPYADATCVSTWPDGMCTQGCDLYCPDQDGAVTTFCIDAGALDVPGAGGMCTMRCDFNLSPTGCRPGYLCKETPRHGQPNTKVLACVPDDGSGTTLGDCLDELIARGVPFDVAASPGDHPDGLPDVTCDIVEPVRIGPVIHGVSLRYAEIDATPSKVFVSCAAALAIEETTALLATEAVTDLVHLGTYNCRVIAGTTKLSQHGLANAIDIAGVGFADGSYWTVLDHWEDGIPSPVTEAGQFLYWLAHSLYEQWIWNIILTPEYNEAHDNHFHVDMTTGSHFLSE